MNAPRPPEIEMLCFGGRGTLFDWSLGLLATMQPILEQHELRSERDAIVRAYLRAESAVFADAPACRHLPWSEAMRRVYAAMAADLGIPVSRDVVDDLQRAVRNWPVHNDAREFCTRVGDRLRFAVTSNLSSRVLLDMLAQVNVDFELVLCADDVGYYKPHAKLFQRLAEGVGPTPEHILWVSSSYELDLRSASAAGFQTAWILRDDSFGKLDGESDVPEGQLRFPDLRALGDWLIDEARIPA